MRRRFSCVFAVAVLGCLSPSLCAQYYNPYSAPPMYYAPQGYGYPNPMMRPPAYYYAPMPMGQQPMYYYPQMQGQPNPYYTQRSAPPVFNYGPMLVNTPASTTGTASANPAPKNVPALPTSIVKANGNAPVTGTCPPGGCLPNTCSDGCNSCGDGCNACGDGCNACNDGCAKPLPLAPPHPRGHFVGMVGLELLVPYPQNRSAFTTTNASGSTSTTDFSQHVDYAPFVQLGYVFHNGWGIRGDFMYLHGTNSLTASNTDVGTTISTPAAAPFALTSPSAALLAGIGSDQFTMTRSFDFKVADLEVVKECSVCDMFFTFGAGARYAEISQGYSATRVNPGGVNATTATVVSLDHEDLSLGSRFGGFGPTLSMEFVHPIKGSCFSFYANLRGSALYGVEQLQQQHNVQGATTVGGVTTLDNASDIGASATHPVVPMFDGELGIQIGKRFGPCYLFGRVGAVYSRWWNVGDPFGGTGNLDIVGGAVKVGIVY